MPTLVRKPFNGVQHYSVDYCDGTRSAKPAPGEVRVAITDEQAKLGLDVLGAFYETGRLHK